MDISAFPNWEKYAIPQRRPETGCIPTSYEMILRAAGIKGINFSTFQDDFDLDKTLQPGQKPKNDFTSVANAIRKKYPNVNFQREDFPTGNKKLSFVEEHIASKVPVLVSLSKAPFGGKGWHIMPVVDATEDKLILLNKVKPDGSIERCVLTKSEFVRIHDNYDGGKDVAYLVTM